MNQGPDESGQVPTDGVPSEVLQTSSAFYDAITNAGGDANTGLLWYPIARSVNLNFLDDIVREGVRDGAQRLEQMIDGIAKSCPGTRFVLNGYSEGAWVIDCWLHGNMPGANQHTCTTGTGGGRHYNSIAGVSLYGDPQWDGNPDKGIARLAPFRALDPYIPTGHLTNRFRSWCAPGDPICGHGLNDNDLLSRLGKASDCGKNPACPHFAYKDLQFTETEGQWLASLALRP
jgi:hypothetical protein